MKHQLRKPCINENSQKVKELEINKKHKKEKQLIQKLKIQKNQHTLKYLEKAEALPGNRKLDSRKL